jgi:hypothetical protein
MTGGKGPKKDKYQNDRVQSKTDFRGAAKPNGRQYDRLRRHYPLYSGRVSSRVLISFRWP